MHFVRRWRFRASLCDHQTMLIRGPSSVGVGLSARIGLRPNSPVPGLVRLGSNGRNEWGRMSRRRRRFSSPTFALRQTDFEQLAGEIRPVADPISDLAAAPVYAID